MKYIPKLQQGSIIKGQQGLPSFTDFSNNQKANTIPKPTFNFMGIINNPDPNDYTYKFGKTNNKEEEFAKVMKPIFLSALQSNNYPTTEIDDIVRQSALESNYGLNPRGNGYNLAGIKNFTNDPSKGTVFAGDNQNYLNFKDLKDFANYKVQLLNNRYNALSAKDTNDFVNRLHGNNPTKQNYSSNKSGYLSNLNNMKSLNKYL